MKITIDTKEDSPEDIRRLIRLLLALVGDATSYPEKAPPASGEGLFDMFGDPQASTPEQQQLGTGSSSGGSQGGMDINDFIDRADEQSQQNSGSSNDDENVRVVPY